MDKKLLEIRTEIIKLREEMREEKIIIMAKIAELLVELQDKCEHISIIETGYIADVKIPNMKPPRRICLICSIEEDGLEYKILTKEPIRIVKREKFYDYRDLKPFEMRPVPTE